MLKAVLIILGLWLYGCTNSKIERQLLDYSGQPLVEVYEVASTEPEVRDGEYLLKTQDGKQLRLAEYQRGKLWAVHQQWDKAGKTLETNALTNGTGILNHYTPEGQLVASFPYKDGYPNGEAVFYDTHKQVTARVLYAAGHPTSSSALPNATAFFVADSANKVTAASASMPTGFDPKVADEVLNKLQKEDIASIYNQAYPKYKSAFSRAIFDKYINYCKTLYGPIKSYNRQTYNITGNSAIGEGLEIYYDVQFGYCKGAIIISMIKDNGIFKLASLSYKVAPYTPITQIRKAVEPFLELLKQGQADKFYAAGSNRFKQAMKLQQAEAMIEEIKKVGGISEYQLYNHMVGVDNDQIIIAAEYEVTIGGKGFIASILVSETSANNFVLEGLQLNSAQ